MKKVFIRTIASTMLCALFLTSCSGGPQNAPSSGGQPGGSSGQGSGGQAEYNFTIGTSATKDSAIGKTMQYAADLIEERTNGRIKITCYPDSALGSDAELVEGVQLNNVTMVIGNTAPQVTFVPDLALFDLPNTYDDISVAPDRFVWLYQ